MFDKSKTKNITTIYLPTHTIDGGYIYISKKIIKKFPKKPFPGIFQFGNETLRFSAFLDSNNRLRIDTSLPDTNSLYSLYKKYKIKPGYKVIINIRTEKREKKWIFIFQPRSKRIDKKQEEPLVAPSLTNQFSAFSSIVQNIGMRNFLKGISIMSELNTLFTKTYKEVLDPTYLIKYSINDCIDEIQKDIRLHAFFNMYWQSSSVRRLFSYRAEDVLPQPFDKDTNEIENNIDELSSPLFYIPVVAPLSDEDIKAVKDIHNRILLELTHRYQTLVSSFRNILYYFSDHISEFEKLEENLNEADLKLLIGEILDKISKEIQKKEIRNDLKKLIKDFIQDWGWLFPRVFWFYIEKQIKTTDKWMSELSYRCKLDINTIYEAFDSLIENDVLRPLILICWCKKHPEKPQYSISTGIGSKGRYFCGICHDEMKCLIVTSIHPSILKFLKHHDGLPLIASAWLAQKDGLQWETNYTNKDIEIDLWIANHKGSKSAIFEFWITNVVEDSRAFIRRLNNKKHQLDKNMEKLDGKINKISINDKYLVVNTSKSNLSGLLKQQKLKDEFKVISIDEIEDVFKNYI